MAGLGFYIDPAPVDRWRTGSDRRILGSILFGLLLITFLFAGVVSATGDTAMFRYNAQRTGDYSPVAGNMSNGKLLWKTRIGGFPLSDYLYSSPTVANGVVYVGSDDNKTYALNASTGVILWNYTTGNAVYSSPAVADGVVYVGSYDNKIYALDALTGTKLWDYTTGSHVISSPAVADGVVYVGSNDGNAYALNATTGAKIWNYTIGNGNYGNSNLSNEIESSPAVANGVVYFACDDGYVYALGNPTADLLPVPDFTADFTTGAIPLTVHFNDTSNSINTSLRNWNFGDGNWTNGTGFGSANPVHTYRFPGSFTVSLTVTNESGTGTTEKPKYINVVKTPSSFNGPRIKEINITPQFPTTKQDITFRADITEAPGYEVTGYFWAVDDAATGTRDLPEQKNYNPTIYRAAAGKYKDKVVRCTITYEEQDTGLSGFDSGSATFKIFFDKGTYEEQPDGRIITKWADDNRDHIPNWFEYWKKDQAVPRMGPAIYDPKGSGYGLTYPNGTIVLYPLAATPHYSRPIIVDTFYGRESFGGPDVNGIDTAAEVIAHELYHKWVIDQWKPDGIFSGTLDSDRNEDVWPFDPPGGGTREWYQHIDRLPDVYEDMTSHTRNDSVDTYNISGKKNRVYQFYGDQEYMAMRAGNTGRGIPANDWANPGKQTNNAAGVAAMPPVAGGVHAMHTSSQTGGNIILSDYNTAGFSDHGTDTNGNSLFDYLTLSIDVGVNASDTGIYNIVGVLTDTGGQDVTSASGLYNLSEGTNTVTLDFSGTDIFHHGVNGPYNFSLSMTNINGDPEGLQTDIYQTAAYTYTSFEGWQAYFSGSYWDAGTEPNSDGKYTNLTIHKDVNVNRPGTYRVEGYLDVGNGTTMLYATSTRTLSPGTQPVALQFDGTAIGMSGKNGPYNLTSLALYDADGTELEFVWHATDTAAYHYTDFPSPAATVTGPFRDYPVDIDGDGLYDELAIETGVKIGTPDTYIVSGLISDAGGLTITKTANMTGLTAGDQTVVLYFDGADIFRHAVSGNYTLTTVMISRMDLKLPGIMTDAYTTQQYDYQDFNRPPVAHAQFQAQPVSGPAPLIVQFTDMSTGFPITWNWSFGDGNVSTMQSPLHVYTVLGTYTVSLNITNADGFNLTVQPEYINVTLLGEPVVANFTATPTQGSAPLTVQFNDTSTGNPTMWNWHLGFAGLSFDRNPVYTFTNPGNYTIMLEVSKPGSSDLILREGYIKVTTLVGSPPVANFTTNGSAGIAPLTVQFNDTSEGDPITWSWSFGDGNLSTLKNPEHTYTTSGTFSVSLTVTNAGRSDGVTKPGFITVFPKGDFNRNNRVDIGDVTRVAYIAAGLLQPEGMNADFDSSGHVEVGDAARIAWYYIGKIPEL